VGSGELKEMRKMRLCLTLCLNLTLVSPWALAEDAAKKTVQGADAEVPAEAKEVVPGVYRFVDKTGKTWLIRRTPFGVMKTEETKEARAAIDMKVKETPEKPDFEAVEEGDTVRFTRSTPFGVHSWTKKKTELSATEKKALELSKSSQPVPAKNEQE
jgi:hypothetical protein